MICKQCNKEFIISSEDKEFYQRIGVPEPTLCHECRRQRRLAFRNEMNLYQDKCDLCGKNIISAYSPDKQQKVYCQDCFWSDKWSAFDYNQNYDPTKSFFTQFQELMKKTPRIALINKEAENSEYCNFALRNKNSYLLFTCCECQDSFYAFRSFKNREICDALNVLNCELCYEIIDSVNCYNCLYVQHSSNCSNCFLGYDLADCHNCFGCTMQIRANYKIFNQQYSEAEYQQEINKLKSNLPVAFAKFNELKKQTIHKFADSVQCENCTGDVIYRSENCLNCFGLSDSENCKYCCDASHLKDCYDLDNDDNSELVYESIGSEHNYSHYFNDISWYNREINYCSLCFHSKNIFGCCSMIKGEFCILNKQYSEDEYNNLRKKIIEDIKKSKEYGEFFPIDISLFAYNETIAQDYYPLTKEEILQKGYQWKEEEKPNIQQASENIKKCVKCESIFRITPQENNFYNKLNIAKPEKCFKCRHRSRIALRNPRKIFKRNCAKCAKEIVTSYGPDRVEKIYCEDCYNKELY
jgi:hypothetical protein